MKIKICPMCQAENAADAVLCQKCFAAIRSVQPGCKKTEEIKICPKCNTENAADAVLCQKCFAAIRSVTNVNKNPEGIRNSVFSSAAAGTKTVKFEKSFACNGFYFSTADVETITNIIFHESKYLNPEYNSVLRKIQLIHDEENMAVNACAGWEDPINEQGPYIKIYEGLIARSIPIAAMYLRGIRGLQLCEWIEHFAANPEIFDGEIPPGSRELGRAMLAEVIAHETAHIIKKHTPIEVRYQWPDDKEMAEKEKKELECNFERDADMTAIKIIESTPFEKDFFLGALLSALALYAPGRFDGVKDSHPADMERMVNLLKNSAPSLIAAGVSMEELNEYYTFMFL